MQTGRKTVESVKESAANAAASGKAGIEKAKASAKEKAERMTTSDPLEKEAATVEKDARKTEAELNKQAARAHNEAARRLAESGGPHPGYKTWATEGTYTTAVEETEGYAEGYAPATGGSAVISATGTVTNTTDRRRRDEPVRSDAPRFDSGGDYR